MHTTTVSPRSPDLLVPAAIALWALAGVALALSGLVAPERMPIVPISIASATALAVVAYLRVERVRAFARAIDLRIPIAYHAIRIVFGGSFLVMSARGELDPTFAERAGWGDLLAGGLALAAVASLTVRPSSRVLPWIFSIAGTLDMLAVIATANWILFFSGHPETMDAMARFPYATIPFFVVPMVLATHALVIARLRRAATADRASGSRTP